MKGTLLVGMKTFSTVEESAEVPQALKVESPHDPAITCVEAVSQTKPWHMKRYRSTMFTAALVTVARHGNNLRVHQREWRQCGASV